MIVGTPSSPITTVYVFVSLVNFETIVYVFVAASYVYELTLIKEPLYTNCINLLSRAVTSR